MNWAVCIQYPNGKERALRSYKNREIALKHIDAIYADGYPMHVAYIVRPTHLPVSFLATPVGVPKLDHLHVAY